MEKQKLKNLRDLLLELQNERLQEYRDKGYDVDSMDDDEIIELDDGDNLLQHVDGLFYIVSTKLEK